MQTKVLEIRDHATFIPVAATRVHVQGHNEGQRYLLRRAGYGLNDEPPLVIVTRLAGGNGMATCDPYGWGSTRTMQVAHEHIQANFETLQDGDVVCVEHILGERDTPKTSERFDPGF